MEVKSVEFQARHSINLLFDKVFVSEIAADINHHAAIREARSVTDLHIWNPAEAIIGKLSDSLQAIEQPGPIRSLNQNPIFPDRQIIGLRRILTEIYPQLNLIF